MSFCRRSSSSYLTYVVVFVVSTFLVLWAFNPQSLHHSLSFTGLNTSDHPRLLLGIMLPPQKIVRRATIRSTWATSTLTAKPFYDYRFVIGGYKHMPWAPLIDAEIATYGDILVLEDFIPDDKETANHIKFIALCDHLARQEKMGGRRYDYVSKVDDDNWLNVPPFFDTFIAPRLPGGKKYKPDALTVIGRPMNWGRPFTYTSGRMYTVSWKVLELLGGKYAADPSFDYETIHLAEDMLPEYFLYTDKIEHDFAPVEVEQAWDIGLEYLVNNETILIHCIKHDEGILKMSTLFDEHGRWNGKLLNGVTNFNRTSKDVIDRLGEVSEDELAQLRKGWETFSGPGGYQPDSKDTLDWKMIVAKINIENRVVMGSKFPMSLPGNNESSYQSSRAFEPIGPATHPRS